MTDILASIGLAQLERYPEILAKRREFVELYDSLLRPYGIEPLAHYGSCFSSSSHLYMVRVPGVNERLRNDIIGMMGAAGIACNVHYKPLPMLTAYKDLGFEMDHYPNSIGQYENEITLPLHTLLQSEDLAYIASTLIDLMRKVLAG
jgi:dTDP-4-amino-4,6-dideoxygalactose transaminase